MQLAGSMNLGSQMFFIVQKDVKNKVTYTLYNQRTKEDSYRYVMGEEPINIVLKNKDAFLKYGNTEYFRCQMQRLKIKGTVTVSDINAYHEIDKYLETMHFAEMYKFPSNAIMQHEIRPVGTDIIEIFSAADRNLIYNYEKKNSELTHVEIHYRDINIIMSESNFRVVLPKLEMVTVQKQETKQIAIATMQTVTYPMLCDALDMTWFEENGIRKKDYASIKTIEEFESLVITPLAKAVEFHESIGKQLLLSIDTETTGLNVYNLSKDNPDKDHCVAIPISWEDNKAFVIFTDMEYFDSIPNDYAMKRLAPFIEKAKYRRNNVAREEIPVQIQTFSCQYQTTEDLQDSHFFDDTDSVEDKKLISSTMKKDKIITFHRSTINLVGHNAPFDGRVFFDFGVRPWFDDDTQQMAFVLSPKVVRGSKKLKVLTRRLLGCETPELENVLGKGNEDKYRYLSEELVAIIYGCADADFTRLVFKELRSMMQDDMYVKYRKQDVYLENILYEAEYNGMRADKQKLEKLAHESEENLNILKDFMYKYVGRYVAIKNATAILDTKHDAGVLSDAEYKKELENITVNEDDMYFEFEMKAADIRDVIYGILNYKIFGYTNGDSHGNNRLPKTDKVVMKKLIDCKWKADETRRGWELSHDILAAGVDYAEYEKAKASGSKALDDMVLISADKFNSCKYPLAIAIAKYAVLNKEYTSYFKPILETNMEGKIFKNFSMSRIETRRIMNPGQTMKGSLKALIEAYTSDDYLLDFDMAQVEYRIMASLAGHTEIIEKMKDPEKDYHIETAALVWNMPAYKVSKKLRKQTKSIGFGVPYGLTVRSLAERLFGESTDENIFKTQKLLIKWEASNKPIMEFLESERDKALQVWNIPDNLRDYMDAYKREIVTDIKGKVISNNYVLDSSGNKIPTKVGRAVNKYGFYRCFDLENLDNKKISKIRRMAGNYPIQSYAAELFRVILIRFYDLCCDYGLQDKIKWHMLIHDELLCSVHKSVHPFLIYKLVSQACMIRIKGHTNYFVGINVGNTWGEVKDDAREAPVYFVKRMVKRYDAGEFKEKWVDNVWEYVKPFREQYIQDRIGEVIKEIQPDLDNAPINGPLILEKMTNYTVRAYVNDYAENYKPCADNLPANMDKDLYLSNESFLARLETWALKVYGVGKKMIGQNNKIYTITDRKITASEEIAEEVDLEELFEKDSISTDSYWSFDGENSTENWYTDDEDDELFVDKIKLNLNEKNVRSVADVIDYQHEYKHLLAMESQIIIKLDRSFMIDKCKKFLKNSINAKGRSVLFKTPLNTTRWLRVDNNFDLAKLDTYIDTIMK